MEWRDVTNPKAVRRAIAEYDRLGQRTFLGKYSFKRSTIWVIEEAGRHYDSKAILGAAHRYQFPRKGPLSPGHFKSGRLTVKKKLEELGFTVVDKRQATGHLNHSVTMTTAWKVAVVEALHRLAWNQRTRLFTRRQLIQLELNNILHVVQSVGATPNQTLSRVLQELRDEKMVLFLGNGKYLLTETPIDLAREDLPGNALEKAFLADKARIGDVPAGDVAGQTRVRKGQAKIRELTLKNYHGECALCDVKNRDLLEAAHIARWKENPGARGKLRNVICMCVLHHRLFDNGYFVLLNDLELVKHKPARSTAINAFLDSWNEFKKPMSYEPAIEYLDEHREKRGYRKR